jgi:hypothetical protein
VASWTCLQLESDILADVRLPSSGIQSIENVLLMPQNLGDNEDDTHDPHGMMNSYDDNNTILIYYCAQLFMRRKLNQIHREVRNLQVFRLHPCAEYPQIYGSECLNAPLEHVREVLRGYEHILRSWRESLPLGYRWVDEDPPATNILSARLRAKYWVSICALAMEVIHTDGLLGYVSIPVAATPCNTEAPS